MNLLLQNGILYADNLQICIAEAANDSPCPTKQQLAIRVQYSPAHAQELPLIDGCGWISNSAESAINVGKVRDGNHKVIPCRSALLRLVALIEAAEDMDKQVTLWIEP